VVVVPVQIRKGGEQVFLETDLPPKPVRRGVRKSFIRCQSKPNKGLRIMEIRNRSICINEQNMIFCIRQMINYHIVERFNELSTIYCSL
jgi:hypothetical protein